jgi:hypothetical protein
VDVLRSDEVDQVLLDVELPDGKGFDVIRRIGPERMPAVVFVTASAKYAIQAFEVNAVAYLLKPFDQGRCWPAGSGQGPAGRGGGSADAAAGSADSDARNAVAADPRGAPR